ncbi:MAG: manganese efflux pump [Lachnospiraceae bacterium]|nr:manganese efflux pump [Lachnospiraceae bacterium]
MTWSLGFFINSILLGAGLAMDAFSVSLANGLVEPGMKKSKMIGISGTYALFQWFMPMAGWIMVHTIARIFGFFEKLIPWIAFLLLAYIGGKMLVEGIQDLKTQKNGTEEEDASEKKGLTFGALMMQGVATSIDALSVGFTIADYGWLMAFVSAVVIGITTWIITICGLAIGKKFGTKLAGKATVLGGVILVSIGLNILRKSLIGY